MAQPADQQSLLLYNSSHSCSFVAVGSNVWWDLRLKFCFLVHLTGKTSVLNRTCMHTDLQAVLFSILSFIIFCQITCCSNHLSLRYFEIFAVCNYVFYSLDVCTVFSFLLSAVLTVILKAWPKYSLLHYCTVTSVWAYNYPLCQNWRRHEKVMIFCIYRILHGEDGQPQRTYCTNSAAA